MTGTALPRSLQDNPALGQWISFEAPGVVTVRTGKVELGQGILTALAQVAAEELAVGLERVVVGAADTALSPNEGFTAGSQSVEVSGASVRLAAAQARAALLAVAADRVGVAAAALSCRDGAILRDGEPTGLDLWSVAAEVDWEQPVRADAPIMPREGRLVGTSAARADMAAKLGAGGFIHDMAMPGMRHARVVRQPFRLARLARVDEDRLRRRHPGVAVLRQADFLALVADDEWAVHRAQADAESFATWDEVPGRWRPAATSGPAVVRIGVPEPAAPGTNGFAADYARGMVAHASIGPSCAVALEEDGSLTVWTHSQGIFALRDQIASCLGLEPPRVRVIHAHGAGCYGHNGADDAALDAAFVATMLPGRPVRVQWSRTDELSRGPLGAAMSARVEASLDARNRVAAWSMSVRSAPHAQRPGAGGHVNLGSAEALDGGRLPGTVEDLPPAAGGGASRNSVAIYDFPSQEVRVEIDTASAIRTSSLRSLGAHLNVFAIESAMDELAALAEADPLDFRLGHLGDERARRVLSVAAAMSGWDAAPGGEGHGRGLAVARYKGKGAYLAVVAEVEVEEEVRLQRLWLAVDAGSLINPDGARSQIEGGAIQSASWTLKEEVRVEDGRVPAFGWDAYPILRFSEVPQVETRFVHDPDAPPLGTGEAAQGPVAAAIGNAVSRALGVRVRRLPLTRERVLDALIEA
jgi:nicotinate dehydrogenase subunit B